MFWTRADGAGQPQLLLGTQELPVPDRRSCPNGKRLMFSQVDGRPQFWSVDVDDAGGTLKAGQPTQWFSSRSTDTAAAFSPDGRWVAYQSDESGQSEVYVRPFVTTSSANEGRIQISSGGGGPAWSPNGRELFYQSAGQMMAVGYTTRGESFVAGKPRVWAANVSGLAGFDIAPDGKRLAVMLPVTTREAPRQDHTIVLLQNFFDELRRRAPADR